MTNVFMMINPVIHLTESRQVQYDAFVADGWDFVCESGFCMT